MRQVLFPNPRRGLQHLGVFALATILCLIPELPYPSPTGADPGHYLAQARVFPNGLVYSPMVPFLISSFSSAATLDNFLPLKLFAAGLFGFLAWSVYLVADVVFVDSKASAISFATAAFSALELESVSWGAFAQILGIGLSLVAFAMNFRWVRSQNMKYAMVGGSALGLAALTHLPSAVFGFAACFSLLVIIRKRKASRGLVVIGLSALPLILVAVRFQSPLTLAPITPVLFGTNIYTWYWILLRVLGVISATPTLIGVFALALMASIGITKRRHSEYLTAVLTALFVGASTLFFVVPAQFPDRVSYYLFVPLPFVAGLSGFGLNRKKLTSLVLLTLVALYATAGASHYLSSLSYYGVLSNEDLHAFQWIQENASPGDGVLVSTAHPQVRGWWLEGTTMQRAFIATDPSWYIYEEERTRAVEASLALAGFDVIDAGSIKLVDGYPSVPVNGPAVFVYNGESFYKVFSFNDALLQLSFEAQENTSKIFAEVPYNAQAKDPITWNTGSESVETIASFRWDRVQGERSVRVESGSPVQISYDFDYKTAIPSYISARFPAPDGMTFSNAQALASGTTRLTVTRQAGSADELLLGLSVENATLYSRELIGSNEWGLSEYRMQIKPNTEARSIVLRFTLEVQGYRPISPRHYRTDDLIVQDRIHFVYLTNDQFLFIPRMETDASFTLAVTFGPILIYKFVGRQQTQV